MGLGREFLIDASGFFFVALKHFSGMGAVMDFAKEIAAITGKIIQKQRDKSQDEKISALKEAAEITPEEVKIIVKEASMRLKKGEFEGEPPLEISPELEEEVSARIMFMPSLIAQKTKATLEEAHQQNTAPHLALPVDENTATPQQIYDFYRSFIPTDRIRYKAKDSVPNRGGWHFESFLGRGTFGEVWTIKNFMEKREALKLCLEEVKGKNKNAFKREVENLKSLSDIHHENLVKVTDVNISIEPYFVTFEYIEGGTLEHKIRGYGNKPMPLNEAVPLFMKICAGMAKAHEIKLVHRDLKPANILIDKKGNPKITDFGIGKLLTESQMEDNYYSATFTMAGAGTLGYMSPEQRAGKGADPADDVYSLGIILYQMLVGASRKQNTIDYLEDDLKSIETPKSLYELIIRCCRQPREKRPVDTIKLLEEVTRAYKNAKKGRKPKSKIAINPTVSVTPSQPIIPAVVAPAIPVKHQSINYVNQGLEKFNRKDLEGAIKDFDEVLRLNANSLNALYYRGLAKHKKGDYERAKADFRKH
ncbi:MAG: protein kinase, partial [Planctomycetota bacterium]